jgi:hypothetical protein
MQGPEFHPQQCEGRKREREKKKEGRKEERKEEKIQLESLYPSP